MLIIWRYLLSQYLKVMVLCVVAFISILLTTRLDEIAHFATLGSEGIYIFLFTLYQIPYILPIAIPISALISSIILIQRLSHTHELTALRASGLPFRDILTPILFAAAFLSVVNFYIVSEMATHSHLETSTLKSRLRAINPLLIVHNKHLVRMKGLYFDILGASQVGETASDAILAMPNRSSGLIHLMLAKKLTASPLSFVGEKVTLITNTQGNNAEYFDNLMIENLETTTTASGDFAQLLQKKAWTINNDHLKFSLLRIRLEEEKNELDRKRKEGALPGEIKILQRKINRTYTEVIRRISVSLAVLTFTFMGAAFAVSIGRTRSNKGLFVVIAVASLTLISYFVAKGIDDQFAASTFLYLAPHFIIILLSILVLNRLSKGIE